MKKSILFLVWAILGTMCSLIPAFAQIDTLTEEDTILNTDLGQAIDYDDIQHGDTAYDPNDPNAAQWLNPLRDGTQKPVENVGGIISSTTTEKIDRYDDGQLRTLQLIKNIINYALWFLAFIAVIYVIYHWFQVVIAGDDEEKYKQALKSLKTWFLAIGGISLSWFVVTAIFYVISLVTNADVL